MMPQTAFIESLRHELPAALQRKLTALLTANEYVMDIITRVLDLAQVGLVGPTRPQGGSYRRSYGRGRLEGGCADRVRVVVVVVSKAASPSLPSGGPRRSRLLLLRTLSGRTPCALPIGALPLSHRPPCCSGRLVITQSRSPSSLLKHSSTLLPLLAGKRLRRRAPTARRTSVSRWCTRILAASTVRIFT